MRDGFNIKLSGDHSFIKVSPFQGPLPPYLTITQSLTANGNLHAVRLIALTYNRRVKSPSDVIERLQFSTNSPNSLRNKALCSLFQIHIKNWLLGEGYPEGVRGVTVDDSTFASATSQPLFRPKLFLMAMSDCELIPVSEDKFEVCYPSVSTYQASHAHARLVRYSSQYGMTGTG